MCFEIQGDHTGMTALKNAPFEGKCSKCAHYSKQIAKLAKAFINADDESIRRSTQYEHKILEFRAEIEQLKGKHSSRSQSERVLRG